MNINICACITSFYNSEYDNDNLTKWWTFIINFRVVVVQLNGWYFTAEKIQLSVMKNKFMPIFDICTIYFVVWN